MMKLKQCAMAICVSPQRDFKTAFSLTCEALYAITTCCKIDGLTYSLPCLVCMYRIFLDQFTALDGTTLLLFLLQSLNT